MRSWQERIPGIASALGVVALVVAASIFLVFGEANRWVLTSAAIGVILIIYAILERPDVLTRGISGRDVRYGSNTIVMTVAFLGILGLINVLAARHFYRLDLTEGKDFSLSEQTINVIRTLPSPVKVTAFYQPGQFGMEDLQTLLKAYQQHTDKLLVDFVDPVANPGLANQYKLETVPATVFELGDRKQTSTGTTEAEVTSALLKLTSGEAKKIYFIGGHGELDLEGFDRNGASEAKRLLERENYRVEPLTLGSTNQIPADASVVVLAGAREKLLPTEIDILRKYLDSGGKLFILVEPRSPGNPSELLSEWGLEIADGVVVDLGLNLRGDPLSPAAVRYPPNPIMKSQNVNTVFPASTSPLPKAERDKRLQIASIAETSERSWIETDPRVVQFDQDKERRGPLPLGVTVTRTNDAGEPAGRLVVIGTANVMTNAFLTEALMAGINIPGNRDLFLNSVGWLAEESALLGVRAKSPADRSLFMTGVQQNILFFTSTVFLPLAVLAVGGLIWWQRR